MRITQQFFEIDSHVISLVCDGIGSTDMNGELAKGFVDSLESLTMDSIREGNLEDIIYSTDENIPTESILKEIFKAIMSTIEWHHSKSDATTFNLTVYNKKTQELSALVLGDSPTFIFKEDEYIRTKESTMNEGKAPLQIDSRQLQLFGGKYWCVDNFYPNLSRRRNPNFIQPKIQSYNNVIGFVSCSDGGAKGMTENMIASIHQRMKNLSPTGVAEMFGRTGILNPRVVNAPPPASSAQQGDTSELGGQIISPLSRSSSSAFEETGESSDTASSNDQGGASAAAYGADLTHRNTGTQNQQANSSNAASSSSSCSGP